MIVAIHANYPLKLKSVKLPVPLQSCYVYHKGKMHTPLLESILPIYKGLRGCVSRAMVWLLGTFFV